MAQMILPKGIVFNTDQIYKEVASYPTVPPEKIFEYWRVYTTTFRKLVDPTANRLENFWWHVMGSDRRDLSGPTLAKLFEDISKGPTFVVLKGPPNRYEGPEESPAQATPAQETPSEEELRKARSKKVRAKGKRPQDAKEEEPEEQDRVQVKPVLSSSAKPPPSHPILKKPRGPSASGPRPKTRFVSPHDSEAEDTNQDAEVNSSGSTAVNSVADEESRSVAAASSKPSSKSEKKKKKTPTFVASTASRRRPAMPRRPSSQSSTGGSEVGSKEGSSSLGSRHLGSNRSVSPIAERPHQRPSTDAKEPSERMSAKAAGKRPAVAPSPQTSENGKALRSRQGTSHTRPVVVNQEQGTSPAQVPQSCSSRPGRGEHELSVYEVSRSREAGAGPSHRRSDAQERARPDVAPPMARSRSDMDSPRIGSIGRIPFNGLISETTTKPSNAVARGTIIEFDENGPAQEAAAAISIQNTQPPGSELRRNSSFVQFTPTQPSPTPSVPLGRTKSQLTLLLERQGEKKPRR